MSSSHDSVIRIRFIVFLFLLYSFTHVIQSLPGCAAYALTNHEVISIYSMWLYQYLHAALQFRTQNKGLLNYLRYYVAVQLSSAQCLLPFSIVTTRYYHPLQLHSKMAETKVWIASWISTACAMIQTVLAIIGLVFVNFWWARKKEKKANEDARMKADAEKIAAVLIKKYDKIDKIFGNFKKNVLELKRNTILGDVTEFDILLYICRSDTNFNNEQPQHQSPSSSQQGPSSGYGKNNVESDVKEIMKFFNEFRIQLAPIHNKECPEDIKTEFSGEMKETGYGIYPFVSSWRQNIIVKVLNYFGHTDIPTTYSTNVPEYIKHFTYKNGKINFEIVSVKPKNPDIETLHKHLVEENTDVVRKSCDILKNIELPWQGAPKMRSELQKEDVLHYTRLVMFMLDELDPSEIDQIKLTSFTKKVRLILSEETTKRFSVEQKARGYEQR